jgi:hypothetical protein
MPTYLIYSSLEILAGDTNQEIRTSGIAPKTSIVKLFFLKGWYVYPYLPKPNQKAKKSPI